MIDHSVIDRLTQFIMEQRGRFVTHDNNVFGTLFGQLLEYRQYLKVIADRFEISKAAFFENHTAFQSSLKPGNNLMTQFLIDLQKQGAVIQNQLKVDVDSFYHFGSILLDRLPWALEKYWGELDACRVNSLHWFCERGRDYARQKNLEGVDDVVNQGTSLRDTIRREYRNPELVHAQNEEGADRRIRGIVFKLDGSSVRIFSSSLYPDGIDGQKESLDPTELVQQIDRFIESAISFIKRNEDKTVYQIEGHKPPDLGTASNPAIPEA